MSLNQQARQANALFEAWLTENAQSFLPPGETTYRSCFIQPLVKLPQLGMAVMFPNVEGEVLHTNEHLTVIQPEEATLVGVATATLQVPADGLSPGQRIRIRPTPLVDIDGVPLDSFTGTPQRHGLQIIGLRRASLCLQPKTSFVSDLVEQLEHLTMPGEMRTVAAALIQAGAKRETTAVLEDDANGVYGITCAVATQKFSGVMALYLDLAADLYRLELKPTGAAEPAEIIDGIYFDSIGDIVAHHIDDGSWLRNHVDLL